MNALFIVSTATINADEDLPAIRFSRLGLESLELLKAVSEFDLGSWPRNLLRWHVEGGSSGADGCSLAEAVVIDENADLSAINFLRLIACAPKKIIFVSRTEPPLKGIDFGGVEVGWVAPPEDL